MGTILILPVDIATYVHASYRFKIISHQQKENALDIATKIMVTLFYMHL